MARQFEQLRDLGKEHSEAIYVCAGDVFDRHNSPPELINFAIKQLPVMYSVPGQHDLQNHRYEDVKRSAYWTLVEAGTLRDIHPERPLEVESLRLWGFPWGFPPTPLERDHFFGLDLAVVHHYIWTKEHCHPRAPQDCRAGKLRKQVKDYSASVFGDNHSPFLLPATEDYGPLLNCGGFFRRRTDERDHKPSVGLLHADGKITRHYLDCSQDKFIEVPEGGEDGEIQSKGMDHFLEELEALGDSGLDFREAVRMSFGQKEVSPRVREIVLKILEESQ